MMNEQLILKQFSAQLHMEYGIKNVTIYRDKIKVYGNSLDNISLEQYMSLSCTTIYIDDDSSKLVSQFIINGNVYVIILFSNCKTTFDGIDAEYIISEIKKLKRKLGE